MKKLIIVIIILLHSILLFAQKNADSTVNKEEILEIGYYNNGDGTETGGSITMAITPDSIFYHEAGKLDTSYKNNKISWVKLISSVRIDKFNKIVSAKPEGDMDGIDTEISIKTSKNLYFKFINSNNYKPIKSFLTQLLKQLKYFNKNVNLKYYR